MPSGQKPTAKEVLGLRDKFDTCLIVTTPSFLLNIYVYSTDRCYFQPQSEKLLFAGKGGEYRDAQWLRVPSGTVKFSPKQDIYTITSKAQGSSWKRVQKDCKK